ncbi:MAG TPA: GNAT family N-acetyltransferase [Rhodanobacteraceae bacterium]|nr:GNAT family N-acetyltransferase [Rhodanobacteraceae bacterium]
MPPRPASRQPVRIRRARRADLDDLVALENRVFAGDRMSARQYRRHLDNPGARVFAAVRGDALVGAAVVFFHGSHRIARLYSIAVAPEARGAGIGEALLAAAERDAREQGSTSLRLEVRTDNPAAQGLYERRGYRRFGRREGYYEDGAAALRYEKALAPRRAGKVSPSRP